MTEVAKLIALDWGTSSLRAYLLGDDGRVVDSQARPWGIMATPDGDFAKALEAVTGDWRRRQPNLPLIAAGMIGSTQGWREIPYVACPAGLDELAAAVAHQSAAELPIVPGMALDGAIPDVMRGEETQIVGALALDQSLRDHSLLVLPGTHSKWVRVQDERVTAFTTHLTGELFAVLSAHSILGRPAMQAGAAASDAPGASEAFDRGVLAVRDNPERSLSGLLFSTRSLVVGRRLPAEYSLHYLSGLLLGEEVRSALAGRRMGKGRLALIGDGPLCQRYLRAFGLFGIHGVSVITEAAAAGLWRIAERAGITGVQP